MAFIGRTSELAKLSDLFQKEGTSCGIILGRRRIGKSELVKEALRNASVKHLYYECKKVSEASNVDSLSSLISDEFGLPPMLFKNIESVLEFFFKQYQNEKIILVLDEYPYLRENVKGLDSIIQSLIDKYKDNSQVKLLLLGSFVDVMNSLLEHSNPLYGRIDLTINLKQLDYLETSKFYPEYSLEDKVRLYSVFGGIPYYNKLVDPRKTVRQNIIDLIASEGARLENEVEMYLNSEISKMPNANQTFEALARGFTKYSDILSNSHVSSGPTLIDVLDKLMRMEVVVKKAPINQESNKKRVGYYISDNLSLFYYRYIFRNASRLSVMDPEAFYDRYIEKDFEEKYVPHIFEDIARQYLIKENKEGSIEPPFYKIGKYYYDDPVSKTNGEFDIVTEDENGYVFYEVKFTKVPLDKKVIEEEIEQVRKTNMNCTRFGFVSRSGFALKPGSNFKLITLKDLYE
ncbi:MAG: ATP-binding protein [Bacilli bacterium]|nr:ATP-binding protein [Bacilli bacterium]